MMEMDHEKLFRFDHQPDLESLGAFFGVITRCIPSAGFNTSSLTN